MTLPSVLDDAEPERSAPMVAFDRGCVLVAQLFLLLACRFRARGARSRSSPCQGAARTAVLAAALHACVRADADASPALPCALPAPEFELARPPLAPAFAPTPTWAKALIAAADRTIAARPRQSDSRSCLFLSNLPREGLE
jgi:hypothetical protein